MRCLSPPSRLDRSSQQRITTTTTTPHCTVLHTLYPACLPASAAAAEGIARGKVCVCVCVEREESVSEGCVEAACEGIGRVSEGYTGRAVF